MFDEFKKKMTEEVRGDKEDKNILMTQEGYAKFKMDDSNLVRLACQWNVESSCPRMRKGTRWIQLYKSLVGSMCYFACTTRYSLHSLSR